MKGILEGVQEITNDDIGELTFLGGKLAKDIPASNGQVLRAGTHVKAWFDFETDTAQISDLENNILAAFDLKVELVAR